MNKCPVRRLILREGKKENLVMTEPLLEPHVCVNCLKEVNWNKLLARTLLKIIIGGLFKALLTHIVLSHIKK